MSRSAHGQLVVPIVVKVPGDHGWAKLRHVYVPSAITVLAIVVAISFVPVVVIVIVAATTKLFDSTTLGDGTAAVRGDPFLSAEE